jgi:hypothetical protein
MMREVFFEHGDGLEVDTICMCQSMRTLAEARRLVRARAHNRPAHCAAWNQIQSTRMQSTLTFNTIQDGRS